MAERSAAERQYTDFDRALVAGDLYYTETHTYRSATTHPPTLYQLNLRLPDLVAALERRWATVAEVNAFGNPATEWRIAVRTTLVDSTRKEPLYPGSHAMVNRPCKIPLHTPIVIRKGETEDPVLYWTDATDYGLTPRALAKYETITARMAQIREHCYKGITRDERRELQYLDLLERHAHNIRARIVRQHLAWLRRRHAVAAMAHLTTPPPAPTAPAGRVGEW
jgi:hypothetical protein